MNLPHDPTEERTRRRVAVIAGSTASPQAAHFRAIASLFPDLEGEQVVEAVKELVANDGEYSTRQASEAARGEDN